MPFGIKGYQRQSLLYNRSTQKYSCGSCSDSNFGGSRLVPSDMNGKLLTSFTCSPVERRRSHHPTSLPDILNRGNSTKTLPFRSTKQLRSHNLYTTATNQNSKVMSVNVMGWSPTFAAGKRGRHSSSETKAGSSAETNSTTDDLNGPFGKRPRDDSPSSDDDRVTNDIKMKCKFGAEELLSSLESTSINTTGDGDNVPGCSNGLQKFSSENVISSICEIKKVDKSTTTHPVEVGVDDREFRIRTSAPKVNTFKNPHSRGPRVVVSRLRSVTPGKLSPSKSKNLRNLKKHKSISDSSSSPTDKDNSSTDLTSASSYSSISVSHAVSPDMTRSESSSSPSDMFSQEFSVSEDDAYVDVESHVDSEESLDDISGIASIDSLKSEIDESPQIVPPIRPSYFPNVPPYVNFCLHFHKTEELPEEIRKQMKWRLSTITPIVVKKTLSNSGFRLLWKTVEWSGHWGRHMKSAMFKSTLKDFQKINHLPGTFHLGRKDRLWKNILNAQSKFGKDKFYFMPRTYCLPGETKQLKSAWDSTEFKGEMWIVKPPAGARGTGIKVVNRWNQVPKKKSIIVQSYISNPYLINDRKFDLRLYVLVTSFNPLKVYLYNDGLVRFAPVKYSSDTKRAGDRFMHLTNYSINKNCELYTQNEDAEGCTGHKWTLKTLWRHFVNEGRDVDLLWKQIEDIVIKTLLAAEDPITSSQHFLPNSYNGYELFGFDIIIDSDFKPWLLEVNISPSLHSSSPLDVAVKGPMIKEVFNIVGFHLPPKLSTRLKATFVNSLDTTLELETPVFDKRLYTMTLSRDEITKHKTYKNFEGQRSEYLSSIIRHLTPDDIRHLIIAEDELSQCVNFYRIFPTPQTHTYFSYFEKFRYYNILFDAWEHAYFKNRQLAVERLVVLCRSKVHLQVASQSSNMISESLVTPKDISSSSNNDGELQQESSVKMDVSSSVENVNSCKEDVTGSNNESVCQLKPEDSLKSGSESSKIENSEKYELSPTTDSSKSSPSVSAVLDNITNSIGTSYLAERFSHTKTTQNLSQKLNEFSSKSICF